MDNVKHTFSAKDADAVIFEGLEKRLKKNLMTPPECGGNAVEFHRNIDCLVDDEEFTFICPDSHIKTDEEWDRVYDGIDKKIDTMLEKNPEFFYKLE